MKKFIEEIGFDPSLISDFNHIDVYQSYEEMNKLNDKVHQIKVGQTAILIRNMKDQEASTDEMIRAFRHLLVIIDAQKHCLNYKQSFINHGIKELLDKYQFSSK